MFAGEIADLVEIADVDRDGDVRGVAVVEEMFEADFDGNGADDFAQARHLEIFHAPDFKHEGAEVFADKRHCAIAKIDGVEVGVGEGGAKRVVGKREVVDEVQDIGEVSPDNFFFKGGEAEKCGGSLLRSAGVLGGLKAVRRELIAEPAEAVGLQIEAQELDSVGVGEIKIGIGVEAREPGGPILLVEVGEERVEVGDGNVGVIFDGLPEVLGGVIGGAVDRDAFDDRVPVGEHARGDGGRGAPAIDGVFPFLLDGDEGVGVSGRSGLGDLREGSAEFVLGVGEESFEGALVGHGDDAALDAAAQEFAGDLLALGVIEGGVAGPATGLRVDIREQFGERSEFDESVKGEGDGMTVLGDDGGGRDESLQGDRLGVKGGREKRE